MDEATVTYCNTVDGVDRVAHAIKGASQLVLDCEGDSLGTQRGSLSILGIRANNHNYLVDALQLSKTELSPIFDVLQSSSCRKIMFDGRMDFSELYHGWGIRLSEVVDLQIADILSRTMRGEGLEMQLVRLQSFLSYGEVQTNRSLYTKVHMLKGLVPCLKEHGLSGEKGNSCTSHPADLMLLRHLTALFPTFQVHDAWLRRPIDKRLLSYAAQDLFLIEKLYKEFERKGYLTNTLPDKSSRYVNMWISGRPPAGVGHPLLPLNVLDPIPASGGWNCNSCKRLLPQDCFPYKTRGTACYVCRTVEVKERMSMRTVPYGDYDDAFMLDFNDTIEQDEWDDFDDGPTSCSDIFTPDYYDSE